MWRPHDKGCKCDECKEAKRREKTARIETRRQTLEKVALDAAMEFHLSFGRRDDRDRLDFACSELHAFEKKHGGRP